MAALRFKFNHKSTVESKTSGKIPTVNIEVHRLHEKERTNLIHTKESNAATITFTYDDGKIFKAELTIYSLDGLKKTEAYKDSKKVLFESSETLGKKDTVWKTKCVGEHTLIKYSKDTKQGFIFSCADGNAMQLFNDYLKFDHKQTSFFDIGYFHEHTLIRMQHGEDKYGEWLHSGLKYEAWLESERESDSMKPKQ